MRPPRSGARLPVPAVAGAAARHFARVGAVALNAVLAADTRLGRPCWPCSAKASRVAGHPARPAVRGTCGGRRRDRAIACQMASRSTAPHRLVNALVDGGAAGRPSGLIGGQRGGRRRRAQRHLAALHEAIRSVRRCNGLVVASGFYQGEGTGLRLGEEFHHNRVRVVGSQIGGTPLPMGLRWNQRRLVTTVLEQIAASGSRWSR